MQHSDYGEMVRVIEYFHNCNAAHVESVPVTGTLRRQMEWNGVVEVFALSGHPRATRAFAWYYQEDGKTKTSVVLDLPPIKGPESAVKVEIQTKEMLAWRRHSKHDSNVPAAEDQSVFDISWDKASEMTVAD